MKLCKIKLIVGLGATIGAISLAYACQSTEGTNKDLDFWVGEWTVTDTTPNAKNPPGKNTIRKIYGGKVVHESFKMGTFEGQSWSVFNPQTKAWNQTWVDNSGGYIAMASQRVNGHLAIQTLTKKSAPLSANRMVFTNVKPDSFTWVWEATADGGKTWQLSWRLEYRRTKPRPLDVNVLIKAASAKARFDAIL